MHIHNSTDHDWLASEDGRQGSRAGKDEDYGQVGREPVPHDQGVWADVGEAKGACSTPRRAAASATAALTRFLDAILGTRKTIPFRKETRNGPYSEAVAR